jgi:diguanylate cyclase (GGDEF)-like protein/PAS domain S-box-containing protein
LERKLTTIGDYADEQYIALENLQQLILFSAQDHSIFTQTFWDNSPKGLHDNLKSFAERNDFYDIFIISLNGNIVNTVQQESDLHTNLLHGKYAHTQLATVFKDALTHKKMYLSDFEYYPPSLNYATFMALPIVKENRTIGVVAIQLDNNALQKMINARSELGKSGEIIALFNYANKMMTVTSVANSHIKAFTMLNTVHQKEMIDAIHGHSGQSKVKSRLGKEALAAWGYQKDFRLGVVVTINQDELLAEWTQKSTLLFLLYAIGVVLVFIMIVLAFRSFLKPMQVLTDHARKIMNGNYASRLDMDHYDTEWQLLMNVFNTMFDDITQKIEMLSTRNEILFLHKQEIEKLNEQLAAKIEVNTQQLREYITLVDAHVITSQTDIHGIITYVSDAFCTISGYSKEQLIGRNHRIIRHPDMSSEFFIELWNTITSGEIWHGEIKNRKSDGSHYWVDTIISPNFEDDRIIGYTAIRHDITYQKEVEALSITDPMTTLFNRRYYLETIELEINRAKRHGYTLALMMIDIDYFKLYNDTYGHLEGDSALIKVASILQKYTSRNGEYPFRLGGEEFALLFSQMSREEYQSIGEQICSEIEALKIDHSKNNASAYVTISMGIVICHPDSSITHDDLYREADKMLYHAKENGRNQIIVKDLGC